jgi:hypothetical protein
LSLTTHSDKRSPSRSYRVGKVSSIKEIETAIEEGSLHFMLFIATDATGVSNDELRVVARMLLDRGLAGLCVWGEDCPRVHDQFDFERSPNEHDGSVVETTWHSDEPINEALWYFANVAYPDDCFEHDCHDWIAIAVGDDLWERTIRNELIDNNEGSPP